MGKKYLDTKENSIESAVMQVWQEAAKLNEFQKVNGQFKKVEGGDKRRTENKMKIETNKNDKSDDGEGLDAVQPKAVKKKFDDRKDKDIDNDGDTDSSDKFLHKKRKAISKAMKKEGLEDSPNPANSQHLCAKNVVHEEWGEGQPVHGMHAIPNSDGDIAWYDVMFEHGIEKGVSINELKVRAAESHHDHGGKKSKKEGAMKRGKDLDTFKPKSESFEQHQGFKVQSMKEAMQKVWEVAEQDRLFETYADMSDEAFDALLEEADKAQLEGIVGALGRGIKKVATMGTASNRADRAEKKLGKAQVKVDNKARVATAKAKTAQLKKDNPSMVKRAAGAVGSAIRGS
jgi:hypothetical protein